MSLEVSEKENELVLVNAMKEKDDEIRQLLYKIKDLEERNHNLKTNNEKTSFQNNLLKDNFSEKVDEMNHTINIKDKEMHDLIELYDRKIEHLTKEFNSSKEDIIACYEKKVEEYIIYKIVLL